MKLAFIGMGNMAYAILKGGCDRGFFNPAHVSAYDINTVRLAEVAAETGITAAVSTAEAARQADMVLLAVKPNVVESVVAEMGDALCGKAVLSIASGWTTEKLRALLPESARVMFVIDRRHRRRQPQRLSLSVQNRLFHWDSRFFLSPGRPLFSTGRPAKCGKVCTLRLFTHPALPLTVPADSTGVSWSGLPDPLAPSALPQGRTAPGKPPSSENPRHSHWNAGDFLSIYSCCTGGHFSS